jgi:muramidase (phage lysozyme)
MDKTVPPGAAYLLNFIGSIEAPRGYYTLYGNRQDRYPWRLTDLTIGEVLRKGREWPQLHGSSACGRYQFMAGPSHTLAGLCKELGLRSDQVFDADLQDRLGYHLLRRRGYDAFAAGALSAVTFAKAPAQEWASLPVLAPTKGAKRFVLRGQSYYAGDGLNKSLVKPERVEAVLAAAMAIIKGQPVAPTLEVESKRAQTKATRDTAGAVVVGGSTAGGGTAAGTQIDVTTFDWTAWLFVGLLAAGAIALVVFLIRRALLNRQRAVAYRAIAEETQKGPER